MRRWIALVAIFALAGCGSHGDLTHSWALPPAPVPFRPAIGQCFDHVATTDGLADYAPYACADLHATESFYVGTLPAAAARAEAADPVNGSPAQQAAGLECVRRVPAFTAGDFHAASLTVRPVLPTPKAWASGARWFRCDILQIELGGDAPISRRGSLKGYLGGAAGAGLTLACFDPVESGARIARMTPVPCTRKHHAEYAGQWAPRRPTERMLTDDAQTGRGCNTVIAKYTGVPDDSNLKYRTGWIGFSPTPDDWNAGIRDVRCFLWLDDVTVTGSYRNAGPKKFKINYA